MRFIQKEACHDETSDVRLLISCRKEKRFVLLRGSESFHQNAREKLRIPRGLNRNLNMPCLFKEQFGEVSRSMEENIAMWRFVQFDVLG